MEGETRSHHQAVRRHGQLKVNSALLGADSMSAASLGSNIDEAGPSGEKKVALDSRRSGGWNSWRHGRTTATIRLRRPSSSRVSTNSTHS